MATVNNRAQLLLAGAFVLAVALIGLTIVLNANSYTTTIAADGGPSVNGGDALTVRHSVERDLAELLKRSNRIGSDYSERRAYFEENVSLIANGTRGYYDRRGRFVNVSVVGFENGFRANSSNGASLSGYLRARNVTLLLNNVPAHDEAPYNLTLNGPAGNVSYLTVNDTVGNDLNLSVVDVDGERRSCVLSNDTTPVRIDVHNGTVTTDYRGSNRKSNCPALDRFGEGFSTYEVGIKERTASGDYWMLINESAGLREEIVYNATVSFEYRSSSVHYETDLRIAPYEIP